MGKAKFWIHGFEKSWILRILLSWEFNFEVFSKNFLPAKISDIKIESYLSWVWDFLCLFWLDYIRKKSLFLWLVITSFRSDLARLFARSVTSQLCLYFPGEYGSLNKSLILMSLNVFWVIVDYFFRLVWLFFAWSWW